MKVIDYITEEVRRQGHDVLDLDGIERVGWMLDAWSHAIRQSDISNKLTIYYVLDIARLIEPDKNALGFRNCYVRVGDSIPCPPNEVESRLLRLFSTIDTVTPLEFYKEFETIHPFVDGNGRTGKVLLNWLNGTLRNPIFPPANLFGREIANP